MGKFARSRALAKASLSILRSDKELLVFPLLSVLAVMLVAATFLLPLFGFGVLDGMHRGEGVPLVFYALAFSFYLVQYFVVFFFTTALVGAAMVRLDGGDPTVGTGLRIAASKWVSNAMHTIAPPSGRSAKVMVPKCSSTIFLTMARPRPVPRARVVI